MAIIFLVLSRMVPAGALVLLCLAMAAIVGASPHCTGRSTAWFHRWTTETDVTDLRIIHKTGFIKRQTFEMSLDKVESVDVNQSILGRIFELWRCDHPGRRQGQANHLHHFVAAVVS